MTTAAASLSPGRVLVNNTAAVSAATFDPNLANNTATLCTKLDT